MAIEFPPSVEECHQLLAAAQVREASLMAHAASLTAHAAELLTQIVERDAQIADRDTQIAERNAQQAALEAALAERDAQIAALQKQVFGRRSEKSPPPEPTAAEIAEEAKPAKEKRRRSGGRRPLPNYLPRETHVIDLPEGEKLCSCCGRPMKQIGEDASEYLSARPIEFFVRRIVRPRYACGACKDRVRQAPMPPQTLPRTGVTAELATLLMLWKYEDHLPLNRLERIFDRSGIELERARMCAWLMSAAELVEPLVRLMEERMLASGRVCADETPLQMQAPGRAKRCWLWVTRGLDEAPYTVFRFRESRGASGLLDVFKDYRGDLLTDAYAAYDKLAREQPDVRLFGCWAHARRRFIEAADLGDRSAREAIDLIGALYNVERDVGDLPERLERRRERSVPQLDVIRTWLGQHSGAPPKSPLGRAVNYALDRWPCLERFAYDGHMPIDNNAVERAIRPVAVGRKNWLFAGSPRGGEAAATFFTLIDSCRRSGHNTFEYISDILRRIGDHPVNRLEELLPDKWTTSATPSAEPQAN